MDRRVFCLSVVFAGLPYRSRAETWFVPYHAAPFCQLCRKRFLKVGNLMQVWRHHDNFLYCCEEHATVIKAANPRISEGSV